MQNIQITPMNAKHIEILEELEKLCFSCPWSFDAFVSELSNPLAVFLVAESPEGVCGYVGMQHILDEGYVCNIAVHPDFRCQGIGTMLMNSLIDYAKENEMSMISLEVRQSNQLAQSFYSHFGFEQEGERRDFYSNPTENALILTRRFTRLF